MQWIGWMRMAAGAGLVCAMAQAPVPDALAQARRAYNDRQYGAAIVAAREAMRVPVLSNAAAVVLARAHLEQYRTTADPSDLDAARAALAEVNTELLAPRDRIEFLTGLGESLFLDGCLDGCFGAAAELFRLALHQTTNSSLGDRESLFEWWAGALDRQAQFGPEMERAPIYRRILAGAETERDLRDDSTSATYWVAAASRGIGDYERAWGAAVAGWVRAKYLGPRGEALRADLDRLVTDVLLPERARHVVPEADPRPTLVLMRDRWTEIKKKYQ